MSDVDGVFSETLETGPVKISIPANSCTDPAPVSEAENLRNTVAAGNFARRLSFTASVSKTAFVPRPIFSQIVQAGGLLAVGWAVGFAEISPGWWLLALTAYFASSCLGIGITIHRAMTHKAFRLAPPLEMLFSFFGAMGATGSPLGWVAIHRTHHARADTDHDPHAPGRLGWRTLYRGSDPVFEWWRMRDILRDPFQRFLHRYYVLVAAGWALALFAVHPLAMVFGFLIPGAAQITVTNLSTILGHGWGYRNFDTRDESTNNALIAALTWGDGWHNNHHARPSNWTLRIRSWELDPCAWVIRLLAAVGGIDRRSFASNSPFDA